jgi:hypothetical protein
MEMRSPDAVRLYFKKPDQISGEILRQIEDLIKKGGGVGQSWVRENIQEAFMVSYALDPKGRVIGSVTLKQPKDVYREKLEAASGLNLSGYLERGYTVVSPEFRFQDIAHHLIKGLIERSSDQRVYVTIRMNNIPALKLACKNSMSLAAEFLNERTGQKIGLFTNQLPPALQSM